MPYRELHTAHAHVEKLMDISTTLADYTQSIDSVQQIPGYLSRMLELEAMTVAVLEKSLHTGSFSVSQLSSSGPLAGMGHGIANRILDIHERTRPQQADSTQMFRSPFAKAPAEADFVEAAVGDLAGFPRASVLGRTINDTHRLCLIVHQRANGSPLNAAQADSLQLISKLLVKLLRCIIDWQARPELLGAKFGRLTDREWVVLQGLNSDDGEKQLADRLGLSPHTLHSHIKSIYRKVGVQGRLPLLLRFNSAVRELRRAALSSGAARSQIQIFAVAAG